MCFGAGGSLVLAARLWNTLVTGIADKSVSNPDFDAFFHKKLSANLSIKSWPRLRQLSSTISCALRIFSLKFPVLTFARC